MRILTALLILLTAIIGYAGFHASGPSAELLKQVYAFFALAAVTSVCVTIASNVNRTQAQRLSARASEQVPTDSARQ